MAYSLFAVIGRDLRRSPALPEVERAKVIELADGFGLLLVGGADRVAEDELLPGTHLVTPALLAAAKAAFPGPVPRALVEASFFGGRGFQFAVAWCGADELLAPITTSNEDDDPPGYPWPDPPLRDNAINVALRAIGVTDIGDDLDEFAHLGLATRWTNVEGMVLDTPP